MSQQIKKISVIGDGGWGTTLAIHLAKKGYPINLWSPFPDYAKKVQKNRINNKFLPGFKLPKKINVTADLTFAIDDAELIVFAIPSQFARRVLIDIKKTKVNLKDKAILNVTKGFDHASLKRISQVIEMELGRNLNLAVLSGPTIASEVALGIPSTATIASTKPTLAIKLQEIFNSDTFRIYTNSDVAGVELGGTLKNVIALACGVCDGLKFGSNTKAAILTRGLAEMTRLGVAMGAKSKTFSGLSGLGDLVTTCVSPKSRNRTVGEQLGKGNSAKAILSKMEQVAEGVETVKSVVLIARKLKVPMPISTEMHKIIYKNKNPSKAVADLMTRKVKAE